MRALILAAGRGSRMGDETEQRPKCLLEVDGRALIEHQLETLADCGVGPIALVVGYRAEDIKEVVGIRVHYIENSRWRNTNSMYSFWLAREWLTSDVLVLNSDVIFHPEVIERMVRAKGDAIAIDSSSGQAAEQMKVEVADGRLVRMSKTLPVEQAAGENVGILRFQEATALRLAEQAGKILEHNLNDWLGAAISEVAKERPIGVVDVADLPWGEIDFQVDLHRVRKRVWPKIRAGLRGRRWPHRLGRAGIGLALLAGSALLINLVGAPPPPEWEPTVVSGLPPVELSAESGKQIWLRLADGVNGDLTLSGPLGFRVESRLILGDTRASSRYAIELELDGVPLEWEDHLAEPSSSWRTAGQVVGKKETISIDLAEGKHNVRLRLASPNGHDCLVRTAISAPGSESAD